MSADVLAAALAAHDAGLCVVRAKADGSKRPDGPWKDRQTTRPDRDQVARDFADWGGLFIVCGRVSGGLEMLELEGRAVALGLADRLDELAEEHGVADVLARIIRGYRERTPGGGLHLVYWCAEIEGNLKLARDETGAVLVETRGEGGGFIAAPSNGTTHPTGGAWELTDGGFATIATIAPDERRALFDVCRMLDRAPAPVVARPTSAPAEGRRGSADNLRPGDEFDDAHTGHDVLLDAGFAVARSDAAGIHYTRPGKDVRKGSSATVYADTGTTTLFSSSINAPDEFVTGHRQLSPWQLHVALNYSGDFSKAAREWRQQHPHARAGRAARPPSGGDTGTGEVRALGDVSGAAGEAATLEATGERPHARYTGPPVLPEEFWRARPVFGHIRRAAYSRLIAADGVLGVVLARVAVATDYRVVLPATVGRVGSLNVLVVLASPSGAGKGAATDTAADLVPFVDNGDHKIRETSAGSGEGMVKQFFSRIDVSDDPKKPKFEWRQTHQGVLVRADEGSLLAGLTERRGQTTLEMLRAAWSGERLGGAYADADRGQQVSAHNYRLALVMGVQPELAEPIFADVIGGLPQRVLWLGVVDPNLPGLDKIIDWPGPIEWTPPTIDGRNLNGTVGGMRRCLIEIAPGVADPIRREHHARNSGNDEGDVLDTHANLSRLKVAALLGVLDGRLDVNEEDWELAGIVMETSTAVRGWVQQRIGNAARVKVAASTAAYVGRQVAAATAVDDVRTSRKAKRVHQYVVAAIKKRGHATTSDITVGFDGKERDGLGAVIDVAIGLDWVRRDGKHFVLGESRPT
jgi:hypothetical protein